MGFCATQYRPARNKQDFYNLANYCKNPRVLRGFYYFTDPDKSTVAVKSGVFIGSLYPAQFRKVSGHPNSRIIIKSPPGFIGC